MSVQFNMTLADNQKRSVDAMADELGTSKAEVFRRAFALLQLAVRERKAGNVIAAVRDGEVVKEIIGIFDE